KVDTEGGERAALLRLLAIQLDRLLVERHDLVRLRLADAEGGFRLAEERNGVRRLRLRRLVEGLVRGIVIELAEGLFACDDVRFGGGRHRNRSRRTSEGQ